MLSDRQVTNLLLLNLAPVVMVTEFSADSVLKFSVHSCLFLFFHSKEIEDLKSELSLQRMKALFESQRVLEMERKLFASERQLETCQSEGINLQVLLDELRIKYEPEGK